MTEAVLTAVKYLTVSPCQLYADSTVTALVPCGK